MRQAIWIAVVLCGTSAYGQGAMGTQQSSVGSNQAIMASMMSPVTGQPYQAQKITKSVQKLSDGTVITVETKGLIARDTEGRIREDLYVVRSGQMDGSQHDSSLQSATVGDPVAHTMTIWTDEKTKMAMQMQLPNFSGFMTVPPPPPPPGSPVRMGGVVGGLAVPRAVSLGTTSGLAPGIRDAHSNEVRTEELGRQSIEGVLATGKRTTTVIAQGKVGNDRPMTIVHEEWTSPELKILVKTLDSDPRTGEQTMVLEGLVRTDPDVALFHAPAGYEVKDMADLMKGLGGLGKMKTP